MFFECRDKHLDIADPLIFVGAGKRFAILRDDAPIQKSIELLLSEKFNCLADRFLPVELLKYTSGRALFFKVEKPAS